MLNLFSLFSLFFKSNPKNQQSQQSQQLKELISALEVIKSRLDKLECNLSNLSYDLTIARKDITNDISALNSTIKKLKEDTANTIYTLENDVLSGIVYCVNCKSPIFKNKAHFLSEKGFVLTPTDTPVCGRCKSVCGELALYKNYILKKEVHND